MIFQITPVTNGGDLRRGAQQCATKEVEGQSSEVEMALNFILMRCEIGKDKY